MPYTHIAQQAQHMSGAKYVLHQTVALAQVQTPTPVTGHDTGGILSTVLQNRQAVIECLIHMGLTKDTNDAAHGLPRGWCNPTVVLGKRLFYHFRNCGWTDFFVLLITPRQGATHPGGLI